MVVMVAAVSATMAGTVAALEAVMRVVAMVMLWHVIGVMLGIVKGIRRSSLRYLAGVADLKSGQVLVILGFWYLVALVIQVYCECSSVVAQLNYCSLVAAAHMLVYNRLISG
jgi:ABC-type amino acid transport system permease subunit